MARIKRENYGKKAVSALSGAATRHLKKNRRRILLKRLLIQHMNLPISRSLPGMSWEDLEYSGLLPEVKRMQGLLNLPQKQLPLPLEPPALEVMGMGVMFDEEDRFTPQRFQTLQSTIYGMPLLQELLHYDTYCEHAERSREKNAAGLRSLKQDLALKKEAMCDFLYDCYPLVHQVPIIRLSVYDLFESPWGVISLHELLLRNCVRSRAIFMSYFQSLLDRLQDTFDQAGEPPSEV